ncbi:sulfur carrier protein ThiS [Desulfosarcina alkanivorans]|nr:sulfur carrier protein ThiS [Desulfosarcina alkanivorans]
MDIQLNGRRTSVATGTTIGDLIRAKDLDPTTVVVERNLAIVASADWDRITLQGNDTLEILRFVGGG